MNGRGKRANFIFDGKDHTGRAFDIEQEMCAFWNVSKGTYQEIV